MLGAIIGDIVGSPYEFDCNNVKTTDFPLISKRSTFTDDTVMTLAVAEGLINGYYNPEKTEKQIIKSMQKLGQKYPDAGYGGNFSRWIYLSNPKPYNSFGNGSAMRVSSVAWLYNNLSDVEYFAEISAKVTHNHPEGIKGAKSTAAAIYLARQGADKNYIRKYLEDKYEYRLSRTCDEIRPNYHHVESCQETVPEAITAFLEGNSFEEVIRLAVSLGGDSDTLTAIAGSIAEAYYPISEEIKSKAIGMLDDTLKVIMNRYKKFLNNLRQEHFFSFRKLMEYKPFFDKKEKTELYCRPREGNTGYFPVYCYAEEVRYLEEFIHNNRFTDYDYIGTLSRSGIEMDMDIINNKAKEAHPLELRAMITSIIRQERFGDGFIAEAIEKGVISNLLEALNSKMTIRMF